MTANSHSVSLHAAAPSSLALEINAGRALARSARPAPLFLVPQEDHKGDWKRIGEEQRKHVDLLLECLRRIHRSTNKSAECRAIAAGLQHKRGFSATSLENKYYAYLKSGDWRVLIDRAKAGPSFWNTDEPSGLPSAFIEFWRKLCEDDQRTNAGAYAELLKIWRTKRDSQGNFYKRIPGYEEWPKADALSSHPRGWSDKNLFRHAPDRFALTVSRQGRAAASDHRRRVFTSRENLCVGQYYLFDDQEYDQRVNWLSSQRKVVRPLGLNALDLASACCFAFGFKPALENEAGVKQKLKERDMLWFVVNVLCSHGYRDDEHGTALIVEHGTAAIRADFEARIAEATGGRVRVERSGINTTPAFAGLFESRGKGNPRFKAHIESFFNLVRNRTARLPAQTGKDRDHAPDEAHGLLSYNAQMLRLSDLLSPAAREELEFPVPVWSKWVSAMMEVYHLINSRQDHNLQGWDKAGNVTSEWRLSPNHPWQSRQEFDAIPEPARSAMAQALALSPALTRPRKLSPLEVWNHGRAQLTRVPVDLMPILLGLEFGVEKTVSGGYITIEDSEIDSEPLRFPVWTDSLRLRNGEKFLTFLNPYRPDALVLTDVKGRVVGVLDRQDVPSRSDYVGVERQLGAARHEERERLLEIGVRHIDKADRKLQMHRNNLALARGEITAKQREQISSAELTAEDFDNVLNSPSLEAPQQKPSFNEHDINSIL